MHAVSQALKMSTMKIPFSLAELFRKRHPASLNLQMEVKTTTTMTTTTIYQD